MNFEIGALPDGTFLLRFTQRSVRAEVAMTREDAQQAVRMITGKLAEETGK